MTEMTQPGQTRGNMDGRVLDFVKDARKPISDPRMCGPTQSLLSILKTMFYRASKRTPRWVSLEIGAKTAIRNGADVNERDEYGQTPFIRASSYGFTNLVRYMLLHGADIHAVTNSGQTALSFAASNVQTDTVVLLLRAGATSDINHADNQGNTAIDWAAVKDDSFKTGLLQILLDAGARVTPQTVDLHPTEGGKELLRAKLPSGAKEKEDGE